MYCVVFRGGGGHHQKIGFTNDLARLRILGILKSSFNSSSISLCKFMLSSVFTLLNCKVGKSRQSASSGHSYLLKNFLDLFLVVSTGVNGLVATPLLWYHLARLGVTFRFLPQSNAGLHLEKVEE